MGTERVLNMDEMLERFRVLGKDLPEAMFNAMIVSAEDMLARVDRKLRGEYLNVRTGRGWQSFQDFARISSSGIQAGIDTDVLYMKAHEQGFHGEVQVREHTAQHRGAIRAQDIKTHAASKRAKVTKREAERGSWTVRAHTMLMNVRARYFMRDTINEAFDPTQDRVQRAVYLLVTTGRVPSPGEINRAA